MKILTGRQAMLQAIKAEGVRYIFGNPGTSESPIMDELENHPDLHYILVLQEGVAMGMADGYARATRQPSFVNLHIETGLANGISLLNNASVGGTPLVLTAANLDVRDLPRGRSDLTMMVSQFTKFAAEATHPEQVPALIRRAFNQAKTPPTGPTFVSVSANALDDEGAMEIDTSVEGTYNISPDTSSIQRTLSILMRSSNPAIIVSDIISQYDAHKETVRVAELLGATVFASQYSAMNFPTTHPQFGGIIRLGWPDSIKTLANHDAVLVVGKLSSGYYMFSNPPMRFFTPGTKLIHMDIDGSNVGSTHPTDVGIIANPKAGLCSLAQAIEAEGNDTYSKLAETRIKILKVKKIADAEAIQRRIQANWNSNPMSPSRMMSEISKAIPSDTIIADDAVTTRSALFDCIAFEDPGSLYSNRGGALGWATGGPMGVKLANPERPVVAVVGEGSTMMTVQGFWTSANENIPVIYLVCNNASYRILKLNMDAYRSNVLHSETKGNYIGMDFSQPLDISGMASAMGVHSIQIEDPAKIRSSLDEALNLGKPSVLDISIDGSH